MGLDRVLQNDKVRAISWSESRPDLLAIQYYQHPTEFRSIEGGAENTSVAHLDVTIVPAWVSAAPVGSSFAKGGRMATHYREWDDAKQMWHYSVEVKKEPDTPGPNLSANDRSGLGKKWKWASLLSLSTNFILGQELQGCLAGVQQI
ncbi:hypothetical protein COOONC_27772 [Cooperia oncophora]